MSDSSADYELKFLSACLDSLETFLLSKEVYGTLSVRAPIGQKPYPLFSLGWLLLFEMQARARASASSQRTQFESISHEIERNRAKWRTAWEAKASKEFSMRLNLWRDFLMEFRKNPEENIDRYEYEVSRRVLLELLKLEANKRIAAELEALQGLDVLLGSIFEDGEFIWDHDLIGSLPISRFWFLYGKLKLNFS